ncbi:MAG TPA: hypothetical protein DIT13_09075 [Verrucomicrobiales bacterium]|nr:hypothetical protein [Verrucomicrobiales bacterium]
MAASQAPARREHGLASLTRPRTAVDIEMAMGAAGEGKRGITNPDDAGWNQADCSIPVEHCLRMNQPNTLIISTFFVRLLSHALIRRLSQWQPSTA